MFYENVRENFEKMLFLVLIDNIQMTQHLEF